MSLLIPGTNSIKDTGYNVANSLRFNDGSSDNLTKSFSSAGNLKTWTYSVWFKLSAIPPTSRLFSIGTGTASNIFSIFFTSGDLRIENDDSSSQTLAFRTDQVFRDPSAWSHLVVACDTTQGTDTNRFKIYHNGSQITSFSTSNYPAQNSDTIVNSTTGSATIGARAASPSGTYFDGYMCEVVMIDGQQLDPTSFGEFNEDSPNIWQPKDVSGLTFGTNGFHLDFENASSLGADVSGNSNNFTVNNLTSVDQSTDTCTNNFATFNPLDNYWQSNTYSDGNLKTVTGTTPYNYNSSTIGVSSGKWYCEVKMTAHSETDGNNYSMIGITSKLTTSATDHLGQNASDYRYYGRDGTIRNNGSDSSYGNSYGVGDIIGIAIDLDNNKLYFSKNGTFQNSGDPTSGSTGTGAISITASASTPIGAYFIAVGYYDGSDTGTFEFNSGNPSFSISSGNSDANGFGNFEYSVPSGYFALCTKNLAEFG